MATTILLIEDDPDIGEIVDYNLRQEKFDCTISRSGAHGLALARRLHPDLILLDLMLPDVGGLDICKTLKADAKTNDIPIIMLTAKGEEIDRIVGLEIGADDYITKPFNVRELLLRVRALLKRAKQAHKPRTNVSLTFGILHIDPERFRVTVQNKEVLLTAIEFKLLYDLITTRGRVATRGMLLDRVWGYDAALTSRTVDTHVKRLREKLGKAADYIETIRGVGYRFREEA